MPYPVNDMKPEISRVLGNIEGEIYKKISKLDITMWKTKEPVAFESRTSGEERKINIGEKWGEVWDCAWFNFIGKVPQSAKGKKVVLLIDISGEACVFDKEGCPLQGLTNVTSEFDYSLGKPGKRVVDIADCSSGNEVIDIWADAGCNDLFGRYKDNGTIIDADIAICNEELRQLYYDFSVLIELSQQISEASARYKSLFHSLNKAALLLNEYSDEEITMARKILSKELNKKGGDPSLTLSAIGHAHIDLAWLWPIRETKRKGARTFSTALKMMEKYPDYIFGASQPQLYEWVKEDYPKLYEKIKEKVKEGRWEIQGGMWVEADTNICSGEALVRQILFGKRFFKEEFNQDMKILWLPDVFGYSGALPQIFKKTGIDYFMTIKLSWSTHNKFPHHTFNWTGIDGSAVLAHMPPEGVYNSSAAPRAMKKAENEYLDGGVSENALVLFGIGDGGGGAGEEHLENLKREKNLDGICPVVQETALDFFKKLEVQRDNYKNYKGELYLEKHQGTYTTQALNKKFNRKLELGLRELEFAAMMARIYSGFEYPTEEINSIWKEVLLYQFHDIIPGSSIKRVYDESVARYKVIDEKAQKICEAAYLSLSKAINYKGLNNPAAIFNSLSWERTEWIKTNRGYVKINIPPLGYKTISMNEDQEILSVLKAENDILENDLIKVKFNGDGTIASIFDKAAGREVTAPQSSANKLSVYHDPGDAWDFSIQYAERFAACFKLTTTNSFIDGPRAIIVNKYKYNLSSIEQKVIIEEGSKRIDFVTVVDWQESKKMLRTSFPVNVISDNVTCEIQFGNIKRSVRDNTSLDMAMYEICAHKWVDLSEPDYGVALLNNCKYGHSVKNNVLDLNLLRSSDYPGENADKGTHEFTYSLLPHTGDYIKGNVAKEGYKLNIPVTMVKLSHSSGDLNAETSFIKINNENVIIETIKKAEDSDCLIIRLYEAAGTHAEADISFDTHIKTVALTDMLENDIEQLAIKDKSIKLKFNPFEIHTIKIKTV